jgi:hypothetical protein
MLLQEAACARQGSSRLIPKTERKNRQIRNTDDLSAHIGNLREPDIGKRSQFIQFSAARQPTYTAEGNISDDPARDHLETGGRILKYQTTDRPDTGI